MERFAHEHPGACLAAWLLDRGLSGGLAFEPATEEWFAAVRELFWEWDPTPHDAEDVSATFAGAEDTPVSAMVSGLRRDPILLHRFLRVLPVALRGSDPSFHAEVKRLRRGLAGLPAEVTDAELAQAERDVLRRAADVMQVDPQFLEHGIVARAISGVLTSAFDTFNLRVALGVAPFRDYLTLRSLQALLLPRRARPAINTKPRAHG